MRPHLRVDWTASPPHLDFPREHNAATHFVDRHLDEGRGDKIAIRDDEGELTYAGLAEVVNRAGNALRALGVRMEDRGLVAMLDGTAFPAVFFGAIKIGAVPVPV